MVVTVARGCSLLASVCSSAASSLRRVGLMAATDGVLSPCTLGEGTRGNLLVVDSKGFWADRTATYNVRQLTNQKAACKPKAHLFRRGASGANRR